MKCSKCQFDNPDATNFCGKCGMPLTADARKTYGLADKAEVVYGDRLLPIGLAEGCTLQRDVKAGQVLSYDDVELPKGRLCDELRTWQENQYQTWKISEKCR